MRVQLWMMVVFLSVASACHKRAPAEGKMAAAGLAGDVTPTQAALDPEAEFADIRQRIQPVVNERVPRGLAGKLKFTPQFDAKNRVIALVPESWVMGDAPGTLKPPPDAGLGATTSMAFGSGCDGRCKPKNWVESFDQVEVRRVPVQQIELDEPIGTSGRVVVTRAGDVRYVIAGVWKPDSARYFFCRATLEGRAIEALQAFVGACRAMDVRRWE